jgi:hypothetical protein
MEAYGHGYVAIDVQLLVSLLDGEDYSDFRNSMLWEAFCCQIETLKISTSEQPSM